MSTLDEIATVVNDDALFTYDSAQWSPSLTEDMITDPLGLPADQYGSPNPEDRNQPRSMALAPSVPAPPNPALGGKVGINRMFGWSTGLRQPRSMRTQFGGATLVRDSMGAHAPDGPVGFSNLTGRRAAAVESLYEQWLPSQRTIQESFTKPTAENGGYGT